MAAPKHSPPSLYSASLRALVLAIVRAKLRWRPLNQFREEARRELLFCWHGLNEGVRTTILDTMEEAITELHRWSKEWKKWHFGCQKGKDGILGANAIIICHCSLQPINMPKSSRRRRTMQSGRPPSARRRSPWTRHIPNIPTINSRLPRRTSPSGGHCAFWRRPSICASSTTASSGSPQSGLGLF
jgi:hypothetical protein